MSKRHSLTVLFGNSDMHMGEVEEMKSFLQNKRIENVQFKFISPNLLSKILNTPNRLNIFNYSFYLAYYLEKKLPIL